MIPAPQNGLPLLQQTVFISFDLENMLCIRRLLPEQAAQYLVSEITDDLYDILEGKSVGTRFGGSI